MWCCTDAIIFGQMYEKQDPEKRKGSCKQIVGYFYLLYIVMIVFSVLGYHVYGETSTLGYPLATLSDIFPADMEEGCAAGAARGNRTRTLASTPQKCMAQEATVFRII